MIYLSSIVLGGLLGVDVEVSIVITSSTMEGRSGRPTSISGN